MPNQVSEFILKRLGAETGFQHVEEALILGIVIVIGVAAVQGVDGAIESIFGQAASILCSGAEPNANAWANASQNAAFRCSS